MRELITTGTPVIFHSSAMLLIAQTDKFLIGSLLSLDDVGVYGVSAQLASVVQVLGSGMAMAYIPLLYKKLAAPGKNDGGRSSRTFRLFVLCLVAFVLFWIKCMFFVDVV